MEVSALNNTMCLCRDREPATGILSILQAGYRRHLHYPVQSQRLLSQRVAPPHGGVPASRGWKKDDEEMNRQGREREERACRSGGFFRLSKYEPILYGYLLPPECFFFGRGNLRVRRNGCIRLWQQHALTHKHYLVSV